MDYLSCKPIIAESAYVSDKASVIGAVKIGEDCSVFPGASIRGDEAEITIGAGSNVQDNATLHCGEKPIEIGNDVTIGHNAIVHSASISDRVIVGMGAIILDGAVIGSDTIIGAGTLITSNKVIPPRSVVVGNPYKILREADEKDVSYIAGNAAFYRKLAESYKKNEKSVENE